MKKYVIFLIFSIISISSFSQKDSLQLGDRYWEDQLYLSVTYNVLNNQPTGVTDSGFSYGLSAGYTKDIPFNRRGNWAAAVGVGYNYDSFNHGLLVDENGVLALGTEDLTSSKIRLHNIEFPIQLRWRTSDAVTYSFWRIYAGVRLRYNFSNTFTYTFENQDFTFTNISTYNNFQTGLEFSAGYGAFNFHMYYGLTPMYKDAKINGESVNTRVLKFGLIFFLM